MPFISQEPPKSSALKEYRVPPRTVEKMRGPKPMENSTTSTPDIFATIKCPNS